jgi:cyclopropane-fatty-acyl-phospholipid synthase
MRLLDIGCGWGTLAMRAAEKYGVRVVGLTLSKNQHAAASQRVAGRDDIEFRLQGWEEFNEPVDRIVSIGALEHFRVERFAAFFARCREVLPADGCMMIHSIVHGDSSTIEPGQPDWDEDFLHYTRFMRREIFPNGQVPARGMVQMHAEAAGFRLTKTQSLRLHYARTLESWSDNLAAKKEQAIALTSEEIYDKYQFYLTRSAYYFRTGHIDIVQFSFAVK